MNATDLYAHGKRVFAGGAASTAPELRAILVKARDENPSPDAATDDDIGRMVAACMSPPAGLIDEPVVKKAKPERQKKLSVMAASGGPSRLDEVLGSPADKCDKTHVAIVGLILARMTRLDLQADANGALRHRGSWELADIELNDFCRGVLFDMRKTVDVTFARVLETVEEILGRDAKKRRQALLSKILGKPSSKAAERELRKWIRAVTGGENEADVQVMLHWIWLVKTKQSGRHGVMHVMPVVAGSKQGSGKSQAVFRLVSPWQELADLKLEASSLTDERCRPALAAKPIGVLDELAGMGKADAAELKSTITASEIGYRPMRSNRRHVLPMSMCFIGTTNFTLADIVKDPSGARRFYELRALPRCDWDVINAIDYGLLWEAVSEDDAAPGVVHRAIIEAAQSRLVWRDPVQRWLDEESFHTLTLSDGRIARGCDPRQGIATGDLYDRFVSWCLRNGEKTITSEYLGRRLADLGWEQFRPRLDGRRTYAYRCAAWTDGEAVRVGTADGQPTPITNVDKNRDGLGGPGCLGKISIKNPDAYIPMLKEAGRPDHPDHPDREAIV